MDPQTYTIPVCTKFCIPHGHVLASYRSLLPFCCRLKGAAKGSGDLPGLYRFYRHKQSLWELSCFDPELHSEASLQRRI